MAMSAAPFVPERHDIETLRRAAQECRGCLRHERRQALQVGTAREAPERGVVLEGPDGIPTIATVHPSSVLRAEDDRREQALEEFVRDLAVVADFVSRPSRRRARPASGSRSQASADSRP